jgi:hypothetical protein
LRVQFRYQKLVGHISTPVKSPLSQN